MKRTIFIGFDPREVDAFAVSRASITSQLPRSADVHVRGLVLDKLRKSGVYTREHDMRDGRIWDKISEAPMSTEFAISRFLVPYLAREGLVLFVDGDILARVDVSKIFDCADSRYAVHVVRHNHNPTSVLKMNNQIQTSYQRKNWSSVMLLNCEHPDVRALTPPIVNGMRGIDLHQFAWVDDDYIAELDPAWNWLAGHSSPALDPKIVHFTDGVPSILGCEDAPFASEWWDMLHRWAAWTAL